MGAYDHGYGERWYDLLIQRREGYHTSVTGLHEHPFFEINLILSGRVKMLLQDQVQDGCGNFLVLTKPATPHFISCRPDTLYSRLYLSFSPDFVAGMVAEWRTLEAVFGKTGRILPLTPQQTAFCKSTVEQIEGEQDPFRQRLLILYLLSHVGEWTKEKDPAPAAPVYILKALSYLNTHYPQKIVAEELARKLFISRTTLMTAFKKYTGSTLNDYLTRHRLRQAIYLLRQGNTEQQAAELCGLGDGSGLIRSFKRCYGMTPRQYLTKEQPS